MQNKINFNKLLSFTNKGQDFYKYVYSKKGVNLKDGENSNLRNPFYDDKNPSLSIYFRKGEYKFKDHGDNHYHGNIINFAGFHYDLDPKRDFVEIVRSICSDLHIDINSLYYDKTVSTTDINFRDDFNSYESEYLQKFGIDPGIALKYGFYPVVSFNTKKGHKINSSQSNPIFAIEINHGKAYKIYQPLADRKEFKHQWIGNQPGIYQNVFGIEHLPDSCEYIIIVEGYKDLLAAVSNGINAVCLDNVNINITDEIFDQLKRVSDNIILCLDNDGPGLAGMKRISQIQSLPYYVLPGEFIINDTPYKDWGKDISDFLAKTIRNKELAGEYLKEQFFKIINKDNVSTVQNVQIERSDQSRECVLSDDLFDDLPRILKESCSLFKNKKEKTIFLISALGIFSGCLTNISGEYDNHILYPNLFVFIVGPAGSGKGIMNYSKIFAEKIHDHLHSQYRDKLSEMEDDSTSNKENKIKPVPQVLFIPANNSTSGLIEMLKKNDETGIFFESEADSLNSSLGKDYGDFSDVLRKAFHHETISYYRKLTKEFIEIKHPRLSIIISGTLSQMLNLIPDNENGLFSRFIFLEVEEDFEIRNVFEKKSRNITDVIGDLGKEVFSLWESLIKSGGIRFYFTEIQQKEFDSKMRRMAVFFKDRGIEGTKATLVRLGVIQFRISMILSMLNQNPRDVEKMGKLVCSDEIYCIADNLINFICSQTLGVLEKHYGFLKAENKDEKIKIARLLRKEGHSLSRIAEIILGNKRKKSTIHNWFNRSN